MFDPISLTIMGIVGGVGLIIGTTPQLRNRTMTLAKANINRLLSVGTTPIARITQKHEDAKEDLDTMRKETAKLIGMEKTLESEERVSTTECARRKAVYASLRTSPLATEEQINLETKKIKRELDKLDSIKARRERLNADIKVLQETIADQEIAVDDLKYQRDEAKAAISEESAHLAAARTAKLGNQLTSEVQEEVRELQTRATSAAEYTKLIQGTEEDRELRKIEQAVEVADLRAELDAELGLPTTIALPGPQTNSGVLKIENKQKSPLQVRKTQQSVQLDQDEQELQAELDQQVNS